MTEYPLALTAPPIWAARRTLDRQALHSLRWGMGGYMEGDTDLNDASRLVIRSYVMTYGLPWLGNVNITSQRFRNQWTTTEGVALWQHSPDTFVYNFQGSFVVPWFDAELERLILAYNAFMRAYYTDRENVEGSALAHIEAIYDRVQALGGTMLAWS